MHHLCIKNFDFLLTSPVYGKSNALLPYRVLILYTTTLSNSGLLHTTSKKSRIALLYYGSYDPEREREREREGASVSIITFAFARGLGKP